METLIIYIQMLAGFYAISIDGEYMTVGYFPEKIGEAGQCQQVIEMRSQKVYKPIDSVITTLDDEINRLNLQEEYSNIALIASDSVNTEKFLGYESILFKEDITISNYLNDSGYSELKLENTFANIDILDEFVRDRDLLRILPYIGKSKMIESEKYVKVKSYFTSINNDNQRMLHFEVIDIVVTKDVPDFVKESINNALGIKN